MNTQEIKTMISTQIDYYEKEIKKQKSELGIADAGLKGALHGVKLVLGNIEMMEEQKNPPFDYSYKTLSRWVRAQNYTEAQIQDIYEYGSDLTPRGYKLPWAKYSIELIRLYAIEIAKHVKCEPSSVQAEDLYCAIEHIAMEISSEREASAQAVA